MYPQSKINEVLEDYKNPSITIFDISIKHDVAMSRVCKWAKDHGVSRRNSKGIDFSTVFDDENELSELEKVSTELDQELSSIIKIGSEVDLIKIRINGQDVEGTVSDLKKLVLA
jgi:hypothetical protein